MKARIIEPKEPLIMGNPMNFNINALDSLKLAYLMVTSKFLYNHEVSWINPNPGRPQKGKVFASDIFLGDVVTNDTIGTYEEFEALADAIGSGGFLAVCSVDKEDTARISLCDERDNATLNCIFEKGTEDVEGKSYMLLDLLTARYHTMFGNPLPADNPLPE